MNARLVSAAALSVLALLAAGCGKKESPPKDAATEQKEALERSKKGAFGTQVNALENAKGMQADLDKKSRENVDKIEQGAK